MTNSSRIRLAVFGFDVETDIGSWGFTYNGVEKGIDKVLQLLGNSNVPATFFWVGDTARRYPEICRRTGEHHEVGCHSLYHENVGPPLFDVPGVQPVLPEEIPHRIELNTNIVAKCIGRQPRAFRSPRLFGGTQVVNVLEDLGYETDASLPMYFYTKPLEPYHPDRSDWSKVGTMRLLEIPNFCDMSMNSSDQYGRDRDQWPLFRTKGVPALMAHIDSHLRYLSNNSEVDVFCFYFHPWEFVEQPTEPIFYGEGWVQPLPFITENCGDTALSALENLIKELRQRGFEFADCHGVYEHYCSL